MEPPVERQKPRLLIASGVLAVLIGTIYAVLPLPLAALYIWPLTLWVLIGIALAVGSVKSPPKPRRRLVALWLVVWLVLDDQPWAFLPRLSSAGYNEYTIVSLNCAGGDPKAAAEAAATGARLILLQESPSASELETLRASLGPDWSLVHGPDASILAYGELRRIPLPQGTHNFLAVEWGDTLVVCLRLQPPIFRLDYWSPDCWRAYARNRESRLEELREVMAWVRANRKGPHVIVGGDFNCPPDQFMKADMEGLARDAFARQGRGWGGTAINTFPLVRIDQIWIGGGIFPTRAEARTTKNSDHRMVIVTAYEQT
jgi:endonuclease/exonuclease/phosphatase (EEP) superfamily protein YafD